jgi:hypothetical protein
MQASTESEPAMVTISIPGTFIALAGAALVALVVGSFLKVADWMLSRHHDGTDGAAHRDHPDGDPISSGRASHCS